MTKVVFSVKSSGGGVVGKIPITLRILVQVPASTTGLGTL